MKLSLPLTLLLLASCGAFKVTDRPVPYRDVASAEGQNALLSTVEEKLQHLHYYNVLGQKQLQLFDDQITDSKIDTIYESHAYLKLQAVRSQVDEIESEILTIMDQLQSEKSNKVAQNKRAAILLKLAQFAQFSKIHGSSVENLAEDLGLKLDPKKSLTPKEIDKEIDHLKDIPEFQVFEKNIDHLSYMLESKQDNQSKKFAPSVSKIGNITGNEFPSKVWSLTFDDGPKKETTPLILAELKKRGLIATFFQLTKEAQNNPDVSRTIREAGMEIASHSYTHQQLTKVGANGLEREITAAVKDLKKLHGTDVKFYRLPYGAGVSTPGIREKIAENGLIHVFWNIDTLDWIAQSPDKIVTRTLALMKKTPRDAGVILFHDIHMRTTIAGPQIMDYLKQDNRRVCTLNEIVTQMNEGQANICPEK